ncbi:DMT family transporter [Salinisphaera hydrothermalis]|uniref:DMT family transporter n=1 Tax=Salinisphaera hydrothermalis TaxID=563188 RepID=UPI003341A956
MTNVCSAARSARSIVRIFRRVYCHCSAYAHVMRSGTLGSSALSHRIMSFPAVKPRSTTVGIMTIVATVFGMALADAFIKKYSIAMTLWQIYVLRSAFVLPVLLIATRGRIRVPGLGWILLRSMLLALMYLAMYAVIPWLKLSVIAASLYTAPLFIVTLSALFLRDPVTPRQWVAILIGFLGVLLVVEPGASAFQPLALVPLGAALFYAVAAVVTQARCRATSAATLAVWLNLSLLLWGALASILIASTKVGSALDYPFLLGHWGTMSPGDWRTIIVLALLMIGISVGLARAYQSPRPQVIAVFDYSFLIFAAFWGYIFFDEIPNPPTLIGMVLIASAGSLVLRADAASTEAR